MSTQFHFYHSCPIQIRFSDIDLLGHVTNSVYQNYLDLGRMNYFLDVFNEKMDWQVEGLIVVKVTTSYLTQIQLNDKVEVRTKIYKLGNKSLNMLQHVWNLSTNSLSAECESVMVGYSATKGVSIPVPERWRDKIISFEKDVFAESKLSIT